MLQFERFSKSYSRRIVGADELKLDAPLYWLRGGNGSGKTTLLQCIAGMVPFDGRISLEGLEAKKQIREYRRAVNIAMAEPRYPEFLRGTDLLRLYAETRSGTADQVQALISAFGASDFVGDRTGTYSSGMKKKLSLILAFIGDAKLILLDEPLITLDLAAVGTLIKLINTALDGGRRLIITSHQEIKLPFLQPAIPLRIHAQNLELV
jgi:ABC-2 type transport system ATP-binding protein